MIALRELTRADIPTINQWRQDRALTDGFGSPHRFIGPEVDEAWYEAYLKRRDRDVRCIICQEGQTIPVGLVSLIGIDGVHRHAEFHLVVGARSEHNQGLGTAATEAMLRHGFLDLNLHRIYLYVVASNTAAIRVYEKAGLRREGTLREAAYKNGVYQDLLVMGILRSEFGTA